MSHIPGSSVSAARQHRAFKQRLLHADPQNLGVNALENILRARLQNLVQLPAGSLAHPTAFRGRNLDQAVIGFRPRHRAAVFPLQTLGIFVIHFQQPGNVAREVVAPIGSEVASSSASPS